MAEYIEREAALAFLNELEPCLCRSAATNEVFSATKDTDLVAYLQNLPAADVRPVVRGKWRLGGYGQISDATEKWYDQFLQGGFFYCSACKERSSVKTNFCPNCGADMREEG